eukprot:9495217-Pyramimonas_sp.AAC.2
MLTHSERGAWNGHEPTIEGWCILGASWALLGGVQSWDTLGGHAGREALGEWASTLPPASQAKHILAVWAPEQPLRRAREGLGQSWGEGVVKPDQGVMMVLTANM